MYMTVTFDWALRLQRKTNSSQTAIISYLMENDNKFYGSYRELAKAMGKSRVMQLIYAAISES